TLAHGRWRGRADFLQRTAAPSDLGPWSYEVVDAKLARQTRAGTILQLCLYSEMVGAIQGRLPARMHVVTHPDLRPLPFRVHDYLAYHRLMQRRLEAAVDAAVAGGETYPDPVAQCDFCRWWRRCDSRRRDDDHLCFVAGIARLQIDELRGRGIAMLAALAEMPLPLVPKPARGAEETYARVRDQARVQLAGRRRRAPVNELLDVTEAQGLCRLPEPSAGDIFLDFEGDPYAGSGGLEYLLGCTTGTAEEPHYHARWALDASAERASFEAFIDLAMARLERWPDFHIYHFAPYEPAALKRLMGRYATREDELDRLLRAGRFVDLHRIVRQALRASVERYALKELEAFYSFERAVELRTASLHLRAFERALELGDADTVPAATRDAIEGYNRDDCISTMHLRDWLERLRAERVAAGDASPRPELEGGAPPEALGERQQRVQALYDRLAADVPADPEERSDEQRARWLLANLLDWHRREKKAVWWEYFRLRELPDGDLLEERAALAGLELVARLDTPKRSVVDRYRFPPQDCEIRRGDELHHQDQRAGVVEAIDVAACTVDVRKGPAIADLHATAVFSHSNINDDVKRDALMRLGEWVAEHGIDAPGSFRAGRDLLLRRPPNPVLEQPAGVGTDEISRRWVLALDGSTLPVQGPPGAGKTYTGARMIAALVRAGRKVGITALGHEVIRNLLQEVVRAAEMERTAVRCLRKVNEVSDPPDPAIREVTDNGAVLAALTDGEVDVVAGTPWLWAREDLRETLDVLFVDEAGQLALADVLSVAQAARNLVLLGDPQQLRQPQQGSHPDGADVSALEHLLDGHETIPAGHGLFLDSTWRLHPKICAFTSELFYEQRLHSRPNLDRQLLDGPTEFAGAGLWFVPVEHTGNQSSSLEEVERIAGLVAGLTADGVHWTDSRADRRPFALADILIIAPFNAQVAALAGRLPGARIGTVDKFQGQEAPVVICSLATSSPEDAPHGMDFLYSLNRLNVAVSRAKTACILVASPRLFEPDCRTPAQMRLANAFCRYLEMARTI
ncbi:MAG: helicase, partial [Geminicoccaceae bacterium]|nr:helicase [Geminicoccaceae bacterium]